MRETYKSSATSLQGSTKQKYPWHTMEIGSSFIVKHGETKLSTLKPYASRMGLKLKRKFQVVDHGEAIGYEVARLPDPGSPLAASGKPSLVQALEGSVLNKVNPFDNEEKEE